MDTILLTVCIAAAAFAAFVGALLGSRMGARRDTAAGGVNRNGSEPPLEERHKDTAGRGRVAYADQTAERKTIEWLKRKTGMTEKQLMDEGML